MNIYKSYQWNCDIDLIVKTLPELEKFSGYSIMVTGSTGLIGSSIVDILIRYNETHDTPISIFITGRSQEKAKKRFKNYYHKEYLQFVPYDLLKEDNAFPITVDYIIHAAGFAYPEIVMKKPVETISGSFLGMNTLLKYAKECDAKRILDISSSEIYGIRENNQPRRENEYGIIDPLNPRNSYSIGKIAAETLCAGYASEYGIDFVIVRPGHIYGPTASLEDNRVSSSFAYMAAKGKDIVIKSDGQQLRSYCYCLDCASAVMKALAKGRQNQAYNVSLPDSIISIKQMAEYLAAAGKVKLIYQNAEAAEKKGFNPMNNSALDSRKLMELGWKGLFDAKTGFSHTIQILKEADNLN